MFFGLALQFNPQSRRCDLVLGEDGHFKLDDTPVTAMLMVVGLDRRAEPDDELPVGRTKFLAPASFSERRGSPCDALDPKGEKAGTRCWLLDRAKETELTRELYAFWLSEGFEWAERETGNPAEIDVEWQENARLAYRCMIEETALTIAAPIGGQA